MRAEASRRRPPGGVIAGWALLVAAVAGTTALATAPAPYVVERPGPVFDTLGEVATDDGDVPLIEIADETTYPTSGSLDLLTVYVDGSREHPISWVELALAWFDPSRSILPIDVVFPDDRSEDEADEQNAIAMDDSQQEAIAAALGELGIPYSSVVEVAEVIDGAPADGVLEAGDQLLAVDGEQIDSVSALRDRLAEVGADGPVELGIRRDGVSQTVEIAPAVSDEGAVVLGIYAGADYDFPFDVDIQLEHVGGPSAGMMFALGIYDKLTRGQLTGGEHIAGTGTISADGEVGAIGGIVQKMYGARAAGADWFLAPGDNCADLAGRVPDGLEVFRVDTLDEAIDAVAGIGSGDTEGLPRCG